MISFTDIRVSKLLAPKPSALAAPSPKLPRILPMFRQSQHTKATTRMNKGVGKTGDKTGEYVVVVARRKKEVVGNEDKCALRRRGEEDDKIDC